jgi:hypothetical protein
MAVYLPTVSVVTLLNFKYPQISLDLSTWQLSECEFYPLSIMFVFVTRLERTFLIRGKKRRYFSATASCYSLLTLQNFEVKAGFALRPFYISFYAPL